MDIGGGCDERFETVSAAFARNFETEGDVGASVAVTLAGECVVDLWGGTATYDDGDGPWREDTIINVWSTTKTMAALCMLVLADRGRIDLDAPVASYWPEFAANGKAQVTIGHVLSHSAGLSGWDEPISTDDFLDHDKLAALLGAQAPWWEPGTAIGYHAISQGYLENEIVRRVDGRTLGTFFADEIAGPLGADFHIGTGADHDARIAHVIPPTGGLTSPPKPGSISHRSSSNPGGDQSEFAAWSASPEWRRAEIPAANGHGNARSVARVHASTACGGSLDGVTILSPGGVDRIFDVQIEGTDMILEMPFRHGMGYGLPTEFMPVPNPRTAFWGGWGGSLAVIDVDAQMSFAYVMNKMGDGTTGDMRAFHLLTAVYESLAG